MAVMMPREKWTDERLDDLQAEVRTGFARVEGELKRLDKNVERIDGTLTELRREMNARFDAMNRNMFMGVIAIVAAFIGSNAL